VWVDLVRVLLLNDLLLLLNLLLLLLHRVEVEKAGAEALALFLGLLHRLLHLDRLLLHLLLGLWLVHSCEHVHLRLLLLLLLLQWLGLLLLLLEGATKAEWVSLRLLLHRLLDGLHRLLSLLGLLVAEGVPSSLRLLLLLLRSRLLRCGCLRHAETAKHIVDSLGLLGLLLLLQGLLGLLGLVHKAESLAWLLLRLRSRLCWLTHVQATKHAIVLRLLRLTHIHASKHVLLLLLRLLWSRLLLLLLHECEPAGLLLLRLLSGLTRTGE